MSEELQFYLEKLKNGTEYRIVARSINSRLHLIDELVNITSISQNSSTSERLYMIINEKMPTKCPYCENLVKFRNTSIGYCQTCGGKTCKNMAQQESIKKNNPVHYFKTEEFRQKYENKMLQKHGTTNYFSSLEGKEKIKQTLIQKYNCDHPSRNVDIQRKICQSRSENSRQRYISILSVNDESLVNYREAGYVKVLCNTCGNESVLSNSFFIIRCNNNEKCCRVCNPVNYATSEGEKELYSFLKQQCKDAHVFSNDRSLGFELDVYVPDKKIAFEFNGVYWHNELFKDKNFHLNKTEKCETNNIKLYHVWQDDWTNKRDIIKSRINAILGIYDHVVYARNTVVKEISHKESETFFDNNHVQKSVKGSKTYALTYNNKIVCAIQIGSSRFKKEQELLRYASLMNTRVIGGIEKLLAFYKTQSRDMLITYCDNSWGDGNFYLTKGFELIHRTTPGYWYVIDGLRKSRFNFQKHKLVLAGNDPDKSSHEIMLKNGFYRIYDCGVSKWKLI